jgi:hypothetical protein
VYQRLVLRRLNLVEYGGEFVILGDDLLRCVFGDVRIGR